jgi:hypothetical protein
MRVLKSFVLGVSLIFVLAGPSAAFAEAFQMSNFATESMVASVFREEPVANVPSPVGPSVDRREWAGALPPASSLAAPVAPATRAQEMSDLVALYNSRFQLPENQRGAVRAQFIQAQDALLKKWLASGALLKVLEVHNDYKASLVYTCYTLRDEAGRFIALAYDKSQYDDEMDRSLLRLMHTNMLKTGVSFIGIGDLAAVRFQLSSLDATSGRLSMDYAVNIKKQQFERIDLELRQASAGWTLIDLGAQRAVHQMMIEFWFNIFTRNGGVKTLTLDSRS